MRRRRTEGETADLFTAADGNAEQVAAVGKADGTSPSLPIALIDSPLVDDTRTLLENRATTLGSLLASERAVEYVACLRAFVDFRERHEPEPLHEDIETAVCG
ncbi:MAG: hypothetical protein J5807_01545, partial [Kiritimatiellae bacterium]|nr:hypothetical protein [Kiritimatiellia bacterium]